MRGHLHAHPRLGLGRHRHADVALDRGDPLAEQVRHRQRPVAILDQPGTQALEVAILASYVLVIGVGFTASVSTVAAGGLGPAGGASYHEVSRADAPVGHGNLTA